MSLEDKPLKDITEADLQALIDAREAERKSLDYKQQLPSGADKVKKEFLADVSSFANTAGGHIIYGMKEAGGVPTELCGLGNINPDAEVLRLENILQSGVRPRLPGISIQDIPLAGDKGTAIIIRIPKSWASPHMLTFQADSKFYARNSKGKYLFDVDELRAAFLLSETAATQIKDFRADRLGKVITGETPVPLHALAKTVVHIIPWQAFAPGQRYDLAAVPSADFKRLLPGPQGLTGGRFNLDGYVTYTKDPDANVCESYVQAFRNGIIELVDTYLLEDRLILSSQFEPKLLGLLRHYLEFLRILGVDAPLFVMLSLQGVRGYQLRLSSDSVPLHEIWPIDRDILLIPEVLLETTEADNLVKEMKSAFDAVWNAAGYDGSQNYDEKGEWKRRK